VRAAVGAGLTAICLVNVTEFANWGLGVNPHYSIRGGLADTAADFIHGTEFEAWKPAFAEAGPSLMRLANRYAPKLSSLPMAVV
jgi:hypothetical protein